MQSSPTGPEFDNLRMKKDVDGESSHDIHKPWDRGEAYPQNRRPMKPPMRFSLPTQSRTFHLHHLVPTSHINIKRRKLKRDVWRTPLQLHLSGVRIEIYKPGYYIVKAGMLLNFWAKAINTDGYPQSRSVILKRYEKASYEDKALPVYFHSIARCLDVKHIYLQSESSLDRHMSSRSSSSLSLTSSSEEELVSTSSSSSSIKQ
ncbi:hypothetical protein LXL04_002974 [Taraxacum kok-saghyz]